MSAFLAGKYDLGWEFPGTINRTDWVQIKDTLKTAAAQPAHDRVSRQRDDPHLDAHRQEPFNDVRVRQAMSMAIDRQGMIDSIFEGVGVFNPPVPAALKEWSMPMDQLGDGAKYYKYDPAEAKRLLAAAGYPNGFPASMCFTTYGSTVLVDSMQIDRQEPEGRGDRRQGRYQGVRRLHLDLLLRQVRFADLRTADRPSSNPTTSCSASTTRGS